MRRRLIQALAVAAALAGPAARGATPDQVDDALAKAKRFLYSKMHENNWESVERRNPTLSTHDEAGGQFGGATALCTYALIASGEDPRSGKLGAAVEWLKKANIIGVYALGCRCQVWLLLPQTDEIRKLAKADADELMRGWITTGNAKGLYGYLTTKKDINDIDHSVAQFGVLGLWACEQIRPETVPVSFWRQVDDRWTRDQQPDGGWFYKGVATDFIHTGTQPSMTAAGVATLFITQDYAHPESYTRCNGNVTNPHIEAGLKYMADHKNDWNPVVVFGAPVELYGAYTLYGVERIAVAGGMKYLGDVDWFNFGADLLFKSQNPDGEWTGPNDVDNTALAMLFLARGRAPVLINKVQYDDNGDEKKPGRWNQRPRDVANFVRWFGRQNERDLAWQITNLRVPQGELHDAPFLYVSGNLPLNLSDEHKQKLRQFCLQGGMILFNSDCGSSAANNVFVKSVTALGRDLFPSYDFRDLPPDHVIFSEQYPYKKWKQPPNMKSLGNGVREMMILLPDDPGKTWQLMQTNGSGREEAYQSVDDVMLYGTDKQPLPFRGTPFLLKKDEAPATRTVKIGRLKLGDNWDPEPAGWSRLATVMHNKVKIDFDVETVDLSKAVPKQVKVLHLTGTLPIKPSNDQRDLLKAYLDDGGTLVVDAAGGSTAFAASVETLLRAMYPDGLKGVLPPENPIYKAVNPNMQVKYRSFARATLGALKVPQVRSVEVKGRVGVYFSPQDLSGGLVGENVDGIVGYDPETAANIMAGIILTAGK